MPPAERRIAPIDLMPDAEFAKVRKERRAALIPRKRLRRVSLGPVCTLHFETYDTMLFQVQEMLLIEKGGEDQVPGELSAYNPLIPQGSELIATILFEIDDPVRRARILGELGGVEDRFFLQVGDERSPAVPEGDVERTREDGKTSSVHFMKFPMSDAQRRGFRDPSVQVLIGCDHPSYAHMAVLGTDAREELAKDLV
jgi:hypothetical protein